MLHNKKYVFVDIFILIIDLAHNANALAGVVDGLRHVVVDDVGLADLPARGSVTVRFSCTRNHL